MDTIYPSWPPVPGPRTGFKTINTEVQRTFTIPLADLHEGAWWTGIRLMHASKEHVLFYVELTSDIGRQVHPFDCDLTWYQEPGEWKALPWAIPARFASLLGVRLEVTVFTEGELPVWINSRLSFQETASTTNQYVFVRADGSPVATWDDYCSGWATQTQGYTPRWATAHLVVPPMSYILRHPEWSGKDTLCLMGWRARAPVKVDGVARPDVPLKW